MPRDERVAEARTLGHRDGAPAGHLHSNRGVCLNLCLTAVLCAVWRCREPSDAHRGPQNTRGMHDELVSLGLSFLPWERRTWSPKGLQEV